MKNPDSPRAYPPTFADSLSIEGREEKIVPRYVQAPALRDHGLGPRNLFWGSATLFLALILLVVAIFLSGPRAMLYVVTGLMTFTALFVLARLHIFRQRNGGFLALALVCLVGTMIPLAEKAYSVAKEFVGSRSAAAPLTVVLPSDESAVPLLTQSFAISKPQGDGKQVRVLHDSPIVIDGKSYLIKAGDRFPYIASAGNETTFAVRDLRVALPSNVIEVIDPTAIAKGVGASQAAPPAGTAGTAAKGTAKSTTINDAELAKITHAAQEEAMRRYPALSVPDSLENAVFVSTYKQLRDAGSDDFFANPEWPIELAELLAKRESWTRGGAPVTTGPSPVLDGPTLAEPAPAPKPPVARTPTSRQPTNLPSIGDLDAGADLPRASRSSR